MDASVLCLAKWDGKLTHTNTGRALLKQYVSAGFTSITNPKIRWFISHTWIVGRAIKIIPFCLLGHPELLVYIVDQVYYLRAIYAKTAYCCFKLVNLCQVKSANTQIGICYKYASLLTSILWIANHKQTCNKFRSVCSQVSWLGCMHVSG